MYIIEESVIAKQDAATNQPNDIVPSSESGPVRICEECGLPMITAPTLRCQHSGERHYLRCFVRRVDSNFIAECIDLDIMAEDKTAKKAIAGLQDAMRGYLEVAFDSDSVDLVLRPSPLSHLFRYYLEFFKYQIHEWLFRHHGKKAKQFYRVDPISYSRCTI